MQHTYVCVHMYEHISACTYVRTVCTGCVRAGGRIQETELPVVNYNSREESK